MKREGKHLQRKIAVWWRKEEYFRSHRVIFFITKSLLVRSPAVDDIFLLWKAGLYMDSWETSKIRHSDVTLTVVMVIEVFSGFTIQQNRLKCTHYIHMTIIIHITPRPSCLRTNFRDTTANKDTKANSVVYQTEILSGFEGTDCILNSSERISRWIFTNQTKEIKAVNKNKVSKQWHNFRANLDAVIIERVSPRRERNNVIIHRERAARGQFNYWCHL